MGTAVDVDVRTRPAMRTTSTLTRRSLLRAGALATAATLAGVRPWGAAPAAAAAGHLRRSSYEGLIGQGFTIGSVELRLLSVSDLAGAAADKSLAASEDAFVLAFSGPLDAPLEAGTHTVTHPELATFDLFLSPVEHPREDRRYEAVVDRSVGAAKSSAKRAAASKRDVASATAAPAAALAAPRKVRLFRRLTLRRTAHGARADIALRPVMNAERVHGRLMRHGKTIAVAHREVRDGRAVLRFRGAADLPAGTYTLLLTVVDDAGLPATRRKRVTLA
jgi:hypothetical protein